MENLVTKTIFFEKKYNTDINNFKTTSEIDEFIENELHKKLKVIKINTNIL